MNIFLYIVLLLLNPNTYLGGAGVQVQLAGAVHSGPGRLQQREGRPLAAPVRGLAPQHGIEAQAEPQRDPVPKWLRERLVHTAGLSPKAVDELTGAEAADRWDRYMREQR